jgi:hypothetical protein
MSLSGCSAFESAGALLSGRIGGFETTFKIKGVGSAYAANPFDVSLVPKAGLEPARLSPLPPQDSVSTRFHHLGKSV